MKTYFYYYTQIFKYFTKVYPEMLKYKEKWIEEISSIEDESLKSIALDSLEKIGMFDSIKSNINFASDLSPSNLKLIFCFKFLKVYLNSLCKNTRFLCQDAVCHLYSAFNDSIDPNTTNHDYYAFYPLKKDSLFLKNLVSEINILLKKQPSFNLIQPYLKKHISKYVELQSVKYANKDILEQSVVCWANKLHKVRKDLSCWELQAATDSTIQLEILLSYCGKSELTHFNIKAIDTAYYPYINALDGILQNFSTDNKDIDLLCYYSNLKIFEDRICYFIENVTANLNNIENSNFHKLIFRNMLRKHLNKPDFFKGLSIIACSNIKSKIKYVNKTYNQILDISKAIQRI